MRAAIPPEAGMEPKFLFKDKPYPTGVIRCAKDCLEPINGMSRLGDGMIISRIARRNGPRRFKGY